MRDCIKTTWRTLVICLLLTAATLGVFSPVTHYDFINYDDPIYVYLNPHVVTGLTWENVWWALTSGLASNWHPLTWLSHMLDTQLFGLNPGRHHLTSLLIHTTSSLLLFLLLKQLTGAPWRSAFVAALFALHPLHVQSVAWVAERKDVLSAFFFMLTLWAYARYAEGRMQNAECRMQKPKGRGPWSVSYLLALAFFALGLMSKPMLVTLPFVLLLLDFWPLRRVQFDMQGGMIKNLLPLFREKIPFFLLTVLSSAATLVAQESARDLLHLPLLDRLGNAAVACVAYLQQTFWPTHLAIFYPHATKMSPAMPMLAAATLLAFSTAAVWLARRLPYVATGWFWYLGMLTPVMGIVSVGTQARADRYTYLPLIGIFILLTWGIAALVSGRPRLRLPATGGAAVLLLALALTARQEVGHWRNSQTAFQHAVQVTENNFVAWICLGIADLQQDNAAAALTKLTRALECARPHKAEAGVNFYLGWALQKQGKWVEALPFLEQAVVSSEQQPVRNYNLGLSLMQAGRLEEAGVALGAALAAAPHDPQFHMAMAALLQRQGQPWMAEQFFSDAVASGAESHCAAAFKVQPPNANLRRAYATALARQAKTKEAISQLEEALKLEPDHPQANFELAELLSLQGRNLEAAARYQKALDADPNFVSALNNLAWLLATSPDDKVRNGPRAVEHAECACRTTEWKEAFLMGTLAAAYAEAGRFAEAVTMAERARDKARSDNLDEVARRNEELLQLYRDGKPYRETVPR